MHPLGGEGGGCYLDHSLGPWDYCITISNFRHSFNGTRFLQTIMVDKHAQTMILDPFWHSISRRVLWDCLCLLTHNFKRSFRPGVPYKAKVEHLFARFWLWTVVHGIWMETGCPKSGPDRPHHVGGRKLKAAEKKETGMGEAMDVVGPELELEVVEVVEVEVEVEIEEVEDEEVGEDTAMQVVPQYSEGVAVPQGDRWGGQRWGDCDPDEEADGIEHEDTGSSAMMVC